MPSETTTELSVTAESQQLALEYMRQKCITDDLPQDIAREYRQIQQQLLAALQNQQVY